jgi:hypothetical protein
MSNQQIYSLAFVYINGKLLTEEASVDVKRTSGSNDVLTVAKGWAGVSPGAGMLEVNVSSVVPADDFEYDAGDDIESLAFIEIGLFYGGKLLVSKGTIPEDTFKHGVNQAASYDFSFRGGFAKRQ